MYLNLHVLFTFAAANPNRDDAGSPKTISYGAATRSRISSQAMTRPKRLAFEIDSLGEKTYRSARTAQRITELAQELIGKAGETIDDDKTTELNKVAEKAISSLTASAEKAAKAKERRAKAKQKAAAEDDAEATDDEIDPDDPKATLVWLAESEIHDAARKLATDFAAKNGITLDPQDFLHPQRTDSLAIAAFGRMFAQRPDLSIEAAIQRAHAFTSHDTVNEVDYFTAVDDLREGDKGAGHLGIAELTGGVYYWHANLDTRQLLQTWTDADADDAPTRLTALFEALFLALPTGRQNTTAHHTLPAVVLAIPARLPASLQTAFETPVRPTNRFGGYLAPSIAALFAEHRRTAAALPHRFTTGRFAGTADVPAEIVGSVNRADSLSELATWCTDQILTARPATP